MTQHLARAAALAAVVLLLGACAGRCVRCVPSAPKEVKYPINWSYRETALDAFWWAKVIDLDGARAKGARGAGTSVAIVGTGVLRPHEDLPNIGTGEATCGKPPSDLDTTNGHGTQLAGIVLGRDDKDARSTRGVAPEATLIPVKVDCGVVTAEALTKGVDAAIARKPDVILIAIGGYPEGPPDVSSFMLSRVKDNPGILFVVASVWDNTPEYAFPAWTQTANALVVASMTLDADKADRTRVSTREIPYGARRGEIWAPGRSVETADIEPPGATVHNQYLMHGTSPAAAIVAGCAALVKSKTGTGGSALKSALLSGAAANPDLGSPPNGRLNCGKVVPSR
jgi:subtilisin family serine protease